MSRQYSSHRTLKLVRHETGFELLYGCSWWLILVGYAYMFFNISYTLYYLTSHQKRYLRH